AIRSLPRWESNCSRGCRNMKSIGTLLISSKRSLAVLRTSRTLSQISMLTSSLSKSPKNSKIGCDGEMRLTNVANFVKLCLCGLPRFTPTPAPDYQQFAEAIAQPGDVIITFNYDDSLERELKRVGVNLGKPHRHSLTKFA